MSSAHLPLRFNSHKTLVGTWISEVHKVSGRVEDGDQEARASGVHSPKPIGPKFDTQVISPS